MLSAWICTLILASTLGWVIGVMSPRLDITLCLISWTTWFRPIFTKQNYFFLRSPQPVFEGQASQCALTLNPLKPEPINAAPKRRAHVFDDMPPLDQVRAEASAILNSEKVWEGLGSIEEWSDDNAQTHVATRAPAMGQARSSSGHPHSNSSNSNSPNSNSPNSNNPNQGWSQWRSLSGLHLKPHQS